MDRNVSKNRLAHMPTHSHKKTCTKCSDQWEQEKKKSVNYVTMLQFKSKKKKKKVWEFLSPTRQEMSSNILKARKTK